MALRRGRRGHYGDNEAIQFGLGTCGAELCAVVSSDPGEAATSTWVDTFDDVPANQWLHVAATHDGHPKTEAVIAAIGGGPAAVSSTAVLWSAVP